VCACVSTMEFSDVYVQTGGLCEYSPDGVSFAVVADHRLIVRNGETMAVSGSHVPHACSVQISWYARLIGWWIGSVSAHPFESCCVELAR
jgi:hypothetical protein